MHFEHVPGFAGNSGLLQSGQLSSEAQSGRMSDRDLIEAILDYSADPDDCPCAAELLERCGGIGRLFLCTGEHLAMKGFGPKSVARIAAIREAVRRAMQSRYSHDQIMSTADNAASFLKAQLVFSRTEKFVVMFLNNRNRLIRSEIMGDGTINQAPVYPREIVKRALDLDACSVILCHNHPSENPEPSSDDIRMTHNIKIALQGIGVIVQDHIIIGGEKHLSFRAKGLI